MKVTPLGQCLAEQRPRGKLPKAPTLAAVTAAPAPAAQARETPRKAAEDEALRLAESYQRGRSDGMDAVRAEANAALEAERAQFAEKLTAERGIWVAEQAEVLGARIDAAMREVHNAIARPLASILLPVIEERVRTQALDELAQAVRDLWSRDEGLALRISGPADLLDAMRERLQPATARIEFMSGDSVDVRVDADRTKIETRLREWTQRLREAVG